MRIPDPQDGVKLVGVLTLSCSPSGSRASGAAPCGPSPALTCPLGLETVQNLRKKNTYILIFNQEGENSAITGKTKNLESFKIKLFCAFRWKYGPFFYFSSKMERT
jgi:hypothetical protein